MFPSIQLSVLSTADSLRSYASSRVRRASDTSLYVVAQQDNLLSISAGTQAFVECRCANVLRVRVSLTAVTECVSSLTSDTGAGAADVDVKETMS